ncbi:MAG: D-cysteine desulfhydrase family protein [Acidimicrobiales bacterium]
MTDLEEFPRVVLGHWPTPFEPCHRLHEQVGGPLIWLKRDDCSGLALGGNKTRKLEFLLGEATANGADGVVTFGAIQSNHARQTAAACARVGLPCDLILVDMVARPTENYRASGNRVLDDLLGATVHVVPDDETALATAATLAEEQPDRYFIDPGGSSPVGALGYVAAAEELATQLADVADATPVATGVRPPLRFSSPAGPGSVVVASSTGGTAAGLIVGLARVGIDTPVNAIAVHSDATHTATVIDQLVTTTAALVGIEPPSPERWSVDGSALGDGYGIETEASHEALLTLARAEGVVLDPVYTAKAFAALLGSLPTMDPDGDVVFLHTGGQAGVFAYADAFS